jgi:alpha-tubulin suppressor-like RCC1 family protein
MTKRTAFWICLLFLPLVSSAQTWVKVSCGGEFSVGLLSNGAIGSWGYNGNGQLGIGTADQSKNIPTRIGKDSDWTDVAAGGYHALAIKKDGSLWAWGLNVYGQLGDGTSDEHDIPVRVGSANDWQAVGAGTVASYAIKKDHSLWAWGNNQFGELGIGSTDDQNEPTRVGTGNDWERVRGGGFHALALKQDHSLWAWGANANGQLGLGTTDPEVSPKRVGVESSWSSISCGFEFSLATKTNGSLWSWGFNGNGQLGIGSTSQQTLPTAVGTDTDWTQVAAGSSYSLAIKKDGTLWGWGFNGQGQLGDGTYQQRTEPEHIGNEIDWKYIAAATGVTDGSILYGLHTIGIRQQSLESGHLCATGANYAGQLGNGSAATNVTQFDCSVFLTVEPDEYSDNGVKIHLTPNPTHGELTIGLEGCREAALEILDVTGKKLFADRIWNTYEWSGKDQTGVELPGGLYLFHITGKDNNGKSFSVTRNVVVRK